MNRENYCQLAKFKSKVLGLALKEGLSDNMVYHALSELVAGYFKYQIAIEEEENGHIRKD